MLYHADIYVQRHLIGKTSSETIVILLSNCMNQKKKKRKGMYTRAEWMAWMYIEFDMERKVDVKWCSLLNLSTHKKEEKKNMSIALCYTYYLLSVSSRLHVICMSRVKAAKKSTMWLIKYADIPFEMPIKWWGIICAILCPEIRSIFSNNKFHSF